MKTKADELFEEAFKEGRAPRSAEYRAGVLNGLRRKLGEIDRLQSPHPEGSVQFDAWHAGADEGMLRGRIWLEARGEKSE